jgi:uncharacterized protein (TIGR00661 family)
VKIFYGICGEGLGHSGRAVALIERLVALGHHVTVFTFADALRALGDAGFHPYSIEGLCFGVTRHGGVSLTGTARKFCRYLRDRQKSLDMIRQLAIADQPDLFLTDFEPLTALAATSLGVPCVSIDNQHRFCQPLGREFPPVLRLYGRLAGVFVRRWIRGPDKAIVAVFHHCPPSPYYIRVEAMVRTELARLNPSNGDHVLLYAKGLLGTRILQVASICTERFVAYGCSGVDAPNIEYKPTSYDGFAVDLASCKAVVCSAGQQLISEARYFGKPVLAVPMPRQHEQEINARFARLEGIGDFCSIDKLSPERIAAVIGHRPNAPRPANGVDQVLEILEIDNG